MLCTPWRPSLIARASSSRSAQASCGSQTVYGAYVSVIPYTCTGRKFKATIRASSVGDGGAPPIVAVNPRSSLCAAGCVTTPRCTVGAAL